MEYALRLFPIGGYVAFPDDEPDCPYEPDDPDLLRKKLLEESQELIEAEDVDHVAAEAADVIYFALVRVVAAGASLNDIEKHLDERSLKVSRRPGNAKAYGHKHFVQ